VVFSDDMQMHAIAKNYGLEEAIRLAILAGVDIMTFSNNISGSDQRTVDKVHSIIREMVDSGTITKGRIDESFRRIMNFKRRLSGNEDVGKLTQQLKATQALLIKTQEDLKNAQNEPTGRKRKKKKNRN
jgi:beta-N-acetylhexosaminidase